MPINRKAVEAITELNKDNQPIGGKLGIPIDGIRQVSVANRPGFVYVRLRDNPNELVQAFNESVSPVYDLPVLVEFKNNRYVVIGRDTDRYSSWGSDSSYLPAHASQHSMLANQMGGGDPVFVDGRQMMPGAAYPSGTLGGPNVLISDFLFRNKLGNWLYIGNTGTADLNTLRPNGSNARMVLVCLDYTSGGFVILTGSTFSATLTGTSQIWPYVPNNNLDQVPLAAIRIVSGTTSIGWDNIYDARQWIDSGFPTGSSGGGGGTPGGNDTNVQFNNAGAFGGVDAFAWNNSTGLYIGAPGTPPISDSLLDLVADGSSPRLQFWGYGASQFASIFGYRARGSLASPSALAQNNEIIKLSAAGFYGGGWTDEQGSFQFVADEAWTITGVGTKSEMRITPRGSTTLTLVQDWQGDFVNIYKPLNMNTNYIHNIVDPVLDQDAATKGYVDTLNTTSMPTDGWILSLVTWTRTGDHTFTVSGDLTNIFRKGAAIRYKQGGAYEYGIIYTSSHSAGTTTVTLIANSDYAMAASAITDAYISYINSPEGFPSEFNWAATFPAGFTATVPTGIHTWTPISPGLLFLSIRHATNGTSNAATFQISLPVTGGGAAGDKTVGVGQTIDNAAIVATSSMLEINQGQTYMSLYKDFASTGWTPSGNKRLAAGSIMLKY